MESLWDAEWLKPGCAAWQRIVLRCTFLPCGGYCIADTVLRCNMYIVCNMLRGSATPKQSLRRLPAALSKWVERSASARTATSMLNPTESSLRPTHAATIHARTRTESLGSLLTAEANDHVAIH